MFRRLLKDGDEIVSCSTTQSYDSLNIVAVTKQGDVFIATFGSNEDKSDYKWSISSDNLNNLET